MDVNAIPEDVIKAAREVRRALCLDYECTFDNGCGCLSSIARAILAERDKERARAVQIARECDIRPNDSWSPKEQEWWECGHADAQSAIADHIADPNYVNLSASPRQVK